MDTLSTTVSNFKISRSLHPKFHEFHQFKNHQITQQYTTSKPITSIQSNKNFTTFTKNNFIPPSLSSSRPSSPRKQSPKPDSHKKATTGFAVALLETARCNNMLETMESDVKRLYKWLHSSQLRKLIADPRVDMKVKGEVLNEVVKKGKFQKYLVKLVNLLVVKSKVEIVSQVLMEFQRIYSELGVPSTAHVMLVSSGKKLEENEVVGIAKRVQKLSGAEKVHVRQFVDQRLPSFAI